MEKVEGEPGKWKVRVGESEEETRERLSKLDKRLQERTSQRRVLEVEEQFMYPLPPEWRAKYGIDEPPPPTGGKKKFHEVQRDHLTHLSSGSRAALTSEEDREEEDSEEEDGEVWAREERHAGSPLTADHRPRRRRRRAGRRRGGGGGQERRPR